MMTPCCCPGSAKVRRGVGLLMFAAAMLSACASLGAIDKAPDRQLVEAMLVGALACKDKPGEDPCDPALQPARVRLTELDCAALPLRSAYRETAHAACRWAGDLVRVNGSVEPLTTVKGDFSLIDITPGTYRPTREWSLGKLEQ